MKAIAVAALLAALSGCGPGPYDYALETGYPIEPPPGSNGTKDQEAAQPYDNSPWFSDERLNLPVANR